MAKPKTERRSMGQAAVIDPALAVLNQVQQEVKEAEHAKERKRPVMPSEVRRRGRKISPTLPVDLIDDLRDISQALGYVDDAGEGVISSAVIVQLLRLAVEAYKSGQVEQYEERVSVAQRGLKWKE